MPTHHSRQPRSIRDTTLALTDEKIDTAARLPSGGRGHRMAVVEPVWRVIPGKHFGISWRYVQILARVPGETSWTG